MEKYRKLDLFTLELGSDLCFKKQLDEILKSLQAIREEIFNQYGVAIPSVRVKENHHLKPLEYDIKINGFSAGSFELKKNSILIIDTGCVKNEMKGKLVNEPAYGCPALALWIPKSKREEAKENGYLPVEAPKIILVHLTEKIKENLSSVITTQYVGELLDEVLKENQFLCNQLAEKYGNDSLTIVKTVLNSLLEEDVGIRNLLPILETVANEAKVGREKIFELVNKARIAIVPEIIAPLADNSKIRGLALSQELYECLSENITNNGGLLLNPEMRKWFYNEILSKTAEMAKQGFCPLVFCPSRFRYGFKKILDGMGFLKVAVISEEEAFLASGKLNYSIELFGTIGKDFTAPEECSKELNRAAEKKISNKDFVKLQNKLNRIISRLEPFEKKVISMRFGLDGERSHTLNEVGQTFDISLEQIRVIEAKALRLLRKSNE